MVDFPGMAREILLTELQSGSSRPFTQLVLGLLASMFILAESNFSKTLLIQFSKNPPALILDQILYPPS